MAGAGGEVGAAHAAAADDAEVNAAVRAGLALGVGCAAADQVRRGKTDGSEGGGFLDEGATAERGALIHAGDLTTQEADGTDFFHRPGRAGATHVIGARTFLSAERSEICARSQTFERTGMSALRYRDFGFLSALGFQPSSFGQLRLRRNRRPPRARSAAREGSGTGASRVFHGDSGAGMVVRERCNLPTATG